MWKMSDDAFLDKLSERLREYGADLERTALPALKTHIGNLRLTFGSFLGLLKKKGLVSEDPYQSSERFAEIQPVSNEPFLESQRSTLVSIRTHSFDTQLANLSEYYQFSLEAMTLPRLKLITQLLRYVRWDSMTENSQESNTKLVAELVTRIRKSDDTLSVGLVNDMITQLASHMTKAFDSLKRITFYKREEYKHLLRTTFWPTLNFAPEEVRGNPDNVQRKIKKEFAVSLKGHPYVQELVNELIEEDFAANGPVLREELLNKLQVVKASQDKPKTTVDPKVELMEASRTLSTSNIPLDAALRKHQENASLFDLSNQSLGERFRNWLRSLTGGKQKARVFQIDLYDPATGATKREALDFDAFLSENANRVRLWAGVANRNGPQYQALLQRDEDEILAWFERQFIDASKAVERVNGLDLYFKTEVPKERRAHVKGVKAEVAQIRTTMSNANKQRHEAVARREEQEQLRRLGIKN
jgi:hypothetical protein